MFMTIPETGEAGSRQQLQTMAKIKQQTSKPTQQTSTPNPLEQSLRIGQT